MAVKQLSQSVRRETRGASRPRRSRRTQEERSTQTRRLLVEAAIQVLQEQGYSNLTITKVADRAGLTNGAMQHHFASRDDLVIAIIDALYPVLELPFEDIGSQTRTVRDRVGAFIDLLWKIYSRREYLVIWDIAFGTRGDAPMSARLKAYQRDIARRIRRQLTLAFSDAGLTLQDTERIFSPVISCLRGFALQSVFGVEHLRSDLDYVKEMACQSIAQCAARKR